MKCTQTILICIVIIFVIASVLCHLIALATNYWLNSSDSIQTNFLNLGLFTACFDEYIHAHENPPKLYNGCHGLYSDYYGTIQDWLVPSWLETCRIIAIIALIMQIVGVILVILLILWIICKWFCCDAKRDCCDRCLMYAAPIMWILTGVFIMTVCMIFADNAFRLQCKDFWVGGEDPNVNHLAFSWGFEVASCILCFITGGFLIWLVVLKSRDDI